MGKLILVRHGETNKNINNRLHSVNDSEVLNDTGRKQVKEAANKLIDFFPDIIFSSKEQRAIQSAEIISTLLKVRMEKIDGMEERNWGVFTDRPWSQVSAVLDPMSLEERYQYIPENGESWKTFETRLVDAVKTLTKNNLDKTIVIVTHGGAIRALMPFLLNVPREESFKYDPDNASLTIFNFDGKGFYDG